MTSNPASAPFRIAVVTGSRAEFGLLVSTLHAIDNHPALQLQLIVTGTHLSPEINTLPEIKSQFTVASVVEMQQSSDPPGRSSDVQALSRGIAGLGRTFAELNPGVVLLLGDRIEAFAAAAAASIGGRLTAHLHGGDRAAGVADEAIRHAITKLAHLHFPATLQSADRIKLLGEDPRFIHCVGSPAVDNLTTIAPADDADLQTHGLDPSQSFAILLQHPAGFPDADEEATMTAVLGALQHHEGLSQYIAFAPNHDAGRHGILRALAQNHPARIIKNLPRPQWIALLKRAALIIGNSSAGLIESAVVGLPCVNVGPRQAGREQAGNVINLTAIDNTDENLDQKINPLSIDTAITAALNFSPPLTHPYGDGTTGKQIAAILGDIPSAPPPLRKRNQY